MAKQLSCGIEFMRGMLLFLNILFVLVGLALIGLGIYIKVDKNFSAILSKLTDIQGFEGQTLGYFAFIMIGGGVITLLIALFGCIGSLWHNRCFLYLYAIILALLMILELTGVIMAFVYKGKLTDVYEKTLRDLFDKAAKEKNEEVLNAFHVLEDAMQCCGVSNASDYDVYNITTTPSCKKHASTGCSAKIIDFLNEKLPIIGGTLGGVIALELFGLLAAIALAVALKHAPDEESYSSNPGKVLGGMIPGRRTY